MSDAELLVRTAAGDRAALGLLYDRHVRPVYAQALSATHKAEDAEDVTQDVFLLLWRRAREVRVVDGSVLPWLLRAAKLTALNVVRRRRGVELLERAASDDVEREVEATLIRAEIARAVGALSPTDRALYELCVEGDLSYERAAGQLGITHASVRNRLHRLKARLRADLRATKEFS